MEKSTKGIQARTKNTVEVSQRDLVLYSPKNCYRHSHKLRTVKDVLSLPSVSLGDLKRKHGRDWVLAYIAAWLVDLNDNSQVKTKMNGASIDFVSERIYESYPLKVTDLTLFFRNVKEGVYGQYYENLSGEKIMEWLKEYFDLRCEYAQMQSQSGHGNFLKDIDRPMSSEEKKNFQENIDKVFKGVGTVKVDHDKKGGGMGTRARMSGAEIEAFSNSRPVDEVLKFIDSEKGSKNEWVMESLEVLKKSLKSRMHDYVEEITQNADRDILESLIIDWEKDPIRKPYADLLKRKRRKV